MTCQEKDLINGGTIAKLESIPIFASILFASLKTSIPRNEPLADFPRL